MMLGLFSRRVFINPMCTKLQLSLAHDEAICEEFCAKLDDVLQRDVTGA
jgi:glutamate-1-semialdehyde 2,1-aminomutase